MIKFSVATFAEAARAVRNVPGSGMGIDIYTHARLEAKKKTLTLTMSDGDIEAHATIDCEAPKPALAAVPAAVLDFFIARAGMGDDGGTIDFDDDMRNVTARHGKARLTLGILRGEDFYLMDAGKPDWSMTMRAHELVEILQRTERATDKKGDRPMLNGPFLHRHADGLKMIGADGRRVHLVDLDNPETSGELPRNSADAIPGIILPPKAVTELQKIFGGDESEMKICGTGQLVVFEAGRLRIVSKLIDATYFDYPRMVPTRTNQSVTVSAERLKKAMDGILVAPKTDMKGKAEAYRAIRLTVRETAVELFVKGDTGDADDQVEASVHGAVPGTEISFVAQFMKDAIEAAGAKDISIFMPAEIGLPFHITGGEGAIFVIGQRRL